MKKNICLLLIGILFSQSFSLAAASNIPSTSPQAEIPVGQSVSATVQTQQTAQSLVDSKNTTVQITQTKAIQNGTVNIYDSQGRLTRQDTYTNGLVTQQRYFNVTTGLPTSQTIFTYYSSGIKKTATYQNYISGQFKTFATHDYDTAGRITKLDSFDTTTGSPTSRSQYTYNTQGIMTLLTYSLYVDSQYKLTLKYHYTAAGKLSVAESFSTSTGLLAWVISYNTTTNAPQSRTNYVYNASNVKIKSSFYVYVNNQLKLSDEHIYNNNGFITQHNSYNTSTGLLIRRENYSGAGGSGGPVSYSDYTYDAQNRLSSESNYAYTLGLYKLSYRYTYSAGKLVQVDLYNTSTGLLTKRIVLEYNANGSSAKRTYYDANLRITEIYFYSLSGGFLSHEVYIYPLSGGSSYETIEIYNISNVLTQKKFYTSGILSRAIDYNAGGVMTAVRIYALDGNTVVQSFQAPDLGDPALIRLWFANNQAVNNTGLIVSHPDDPSSINNDGNTIYISTQAYTYDQALAGIAMLRQGDKINAKKIFDFFFNEMQAEGASFSGFWTVYNVDSNFQWKKYEWRKGMGENAWIALFAMRYYNTTTDATEKAKALQMATVIAKWISTLPHYQGAVAMSPDNPGGNPNFGAIYSTENNLDYYALLKGLIAKPISTTDKTLLTNELNNLKTWLKTQAYDASAGLFKRGGSVNGGVFSWDTIKSLDVNSWAISAIGVSSLVTDFGINIDSFVQKIESTFAVQDNNSFGGDIFTAKGFDFSDVTNAEFAGRSGIKWVEGTNQMILAYQLIADYYKASDSMKSAHYRNLADYFLSRNAENVMLINSAQSYHYADQENTLIYYNQGNYRTPVGQSAPSSGWVYFALNGLNPFIF